jgi:hypothetical protein
VDNATLVQEHSDKRALGDYDDSLATYPFLPFKKQHADDGYCLKALTKYGFDLRMIYLSSAL